jgi:hypothetical protein
MKVSQVVWLARLLKRRTGKGFRASEDMELSPAGSERHQEILQSIRLGVVGPIQTENFLEPPPQSASLSRRRFAPPGQEGQEPACDTVTVPEIRQEPACDISIVPKKSGQSCVCTPILTAPESRESRRFAFALPRFEPSVRRSHTTS